MNGADEDYDDDDGDAGTGNTREIKTKNSKHKTIYTNYLHKLSTQTIERQAIKLLDSSVFCCLCFLVSVHDDADRSSNKISTKSHSFLLSFLLRPWFIPVVLFPPGMKPRSSHSVLQFVLQICLVFHLLLFLWPLSHRQRGQRRCLQQNFTPQMLVDSEAQMYLSVYPRVSLSLHHHRSVFRFPESCSCEACLWNPFLSCLLSFLL